jgi:hypothetical protein
MSLDAFSALSVALLVAFSNSDVIPILSAKRFSQPRPITASIIMALIIHVRLPVTQSHYSLYLTYL